MAGHRYRTNKIKRMHSIIHGLLPVLESMASHPAIAQITPGRISANRRAGDRNITLQYYTDSGFKLLARNPSTIQEVFVVTSEPEEVHRWLVAQGLINESTSKGKNVSSASGDSAGNSSAPGRSDSTFNTTGTKPSAPVQSPRPAQTPAYTQPKGTANPAAPTKDKQSLTHKTKSKKELAALSSPNQPSAKPVRGKKKQNEMGIYADYLFDYDAPVTLDAPTDELLVADHLQGDVTAQLKRLRDQAAALEQAKSDINTAEQKLAATKRATSKAGRGNDKATPKPARQPKKQLTGSQMEHPPTTSQAKPSTTSRTDKPLIASQAGKPLPASQSDNPLAAWLAQSDDQTFKRLANKYKSGDR